MPSGPERKPSPRIVDGGSEQNRREADDCDGASAVQMNAGSPVDSVVDAHDDAQHGDAKRRPHSLLDQVPERPSRPFHLEDGRGAVDHHDAETDQKHGGDEQDRVGLELTGHSPSIVGFGADRTPWRAAGL